MTSGHPSETDLDWSGAHVTEIQMRFGDTDMLGHVNNVAFAQYLETARVQVLPEPRAGSVTVLAHLSVDYRREVKLGQQVQVLILTSKVSRTSWEYAYRVLADGQLAAEARTAQVNVDAATRRPAPLTGEMRAWLAQVGRS